MSSGYVPCSGDIVNYEGKRMVIVQKAYSTTPGSFTVFLISENFILKSVPLFIKTEELLAECTKIKCTYDTIPFYKLDKLPPFAIKEESYIKIS